MRAGRRGESMHRISAAAPPLTTRSEARTTMGMLLVPIALWASTLGIIALDKSMRAKAQRSSDEAPSFAEEPSWGVLVALCVLLNIAALPYYFSATRRSLLWGLVGCGAFVACLTLTAVTFFATGGGAVFLRW